MNIQPSLARPEKTDTGIATSGNAGQQGADFPADAEEPIRSHFLDEERLRTLGEALARGDVSELAALKPFDFQARLRDNAKKILAVYRATNAAQGRGEAVTPAAQWLLDNNYLVEETTFQVKRDLPRRFYRELPTLRLPDGNSLPRALALAWVYVAHCDSAVSAQSFRAIVEGYQEVEPLKIGELWALPSLLRFVLVENIRRIAVRVERTRRMRQIANDVADRLADPGDPRSTLADCAEYARDTTFATQLLFRLRDGSQNAGQALTWLEDELEKSGSDAEETILAEHQTLSSGGVTTGNVIRGLRLINDTDWTVWFEQVSRVDAVLRERSDLALLDFPSRDRYRAAIEDLSRHSGLSEFEVASLATELAGYRTTEAVAAEELQEGAEIVNVGFFLVGPRRQELERQIGYRATFGRRLNRAFRSTGWTGIAVPVFLLTLLLVIVTASALAGLGLSSTAIAVLLMLFAVPASEGALAFFNAVVLQFLTPTRLIGYEYREGVPAGGRTLVVVPALIGSLDDVDETIRNLEVHYLANSKGEVHFALLSDWPDSDSEHSAADDQILAHARDEVARLNDRYPREGPPRFHLLHRRRLYNPSQGCWMGWERKRGKLHELNLLLRGETDTTFLPPDASLPEDVVYVMTLDSDTRMLRDTVTRLVGKLAHPLNRPVIDPVTHRIVGGYSILQPRVTPSLTSGDDASFLQRVLSSNRGIDPYVFAVSDIYQDVFGQGSFTGKGLYHIDAMESGLRDRIPENTVLSHDLLEGALSRAALGAFLRAVREIRDHGSFGLGAEAVGYAEINAMFAQSQ